MADINRLLKIGQALQSRPEVASQFGINIPKQGQVQSVLERAGIGLKGVDPQIVRKGAGIAMEETGPKEARTAQEFGQTQETRTAGLEQFGNLTPAEAERFEIVPTKIGEKGEIVREIKEKQEYLTKRESETAAAKKEQEVMGTGKKKRITSQKDLYNAKFKIGNTFDSWLDTVGDTHQRTGLRPGPIGGIATEVLGKTKVNPYYAGFKGGLTEYAAAVGRIAMPGSRATRLLDEFKKTAPDTFDTIGSGIVQAARSLQSAVATDMADARSTGDKSYDELIAEAGGDRAYLDNVLQLYKDSALTRIIEKVPDLISPEEQVQFLGGLLAKDDETGDYFIVDPRTQEVIRQVNKGEL